MDPLLRAVLRELLSKDEDYLENSDSKQMVRKKNLRTEGRVTEGKKVTLIN